MSRENVKLVESILHRWIEGDTALDALDLRIEWDATEFPDGEIYHGHDGVRRFLSRWLGTWEDYQLGVEQVVDSGDAVVALTHERGRGKGSDVLLGADTLLVFWIHEGKVARFKGCIDRSAGLQAIGLSEQDLRIKASSSDSDS